MSDSSISNFVVSYGGKDANIDVIYRDGQKFFNATKLHKTFESGKESERVPQFLLKDATRKFILQKYTELTVDCEKHNEIKDLLEVTDSNFLNMERVHAYLSSTNKKSLPNEILEPFVHTKKGKGAATYLSEDLFIDYAMQLSTQIKSVVIEVFRKYGWVETLSQEKKSDALLAMSLNEEMKNLEEQYPTRQSKTANLTQVLVDENTTVEIDDGVNSNEMVSQASAKIRSVARMQGKLTTEMVKELLFQIVSNEKRVFESKSSEQAHISQYYILLFDTMYISLFNHRAGEMKILIEQESGTPRDALTATCLLAVQAAENNIIRELYQVMNSKKFLTRKILMDLVVECCEQPATDLFKYSKDIDFLVRDKKLTKVNKIKQFDVSLNDNYETQVKTNLVPMPKKETSKKITSTSSKTSKAQLSFIDDLES